MAEREITQTRKGYDGDILALCNPNQSWSPRFKNDVIKDIEIGIHKYFLKERNKIIYICVEFKRGSKHLIVDKIEATTTNLENLKNC